MKAMIFRAAAFVGLLAILALGCGGDDSSPTKADRGAEDTNGEVTEGGTGGQSAAPSQGGGAEQSTNKEISVDLPGGVAMKFVWIEPGSFLMGSPESEPGRDNSSFDEGPQHQVRVTRGFHLAKYELTQGQWTAAMGTRPWSGDLTFTKEGPDFPAKVSWNDVLAFIDALNEAAGEPLYRLPTEAEWEYACRARTTTRWSFGEDEGRLKDYAWYDANTWGNREVYPHAVGTRKANPWGLYDMHGNVMEWCSDLFGEYDSDSQTDPTGPEFGSSRVVRGGHIGSEARNTRSATRGWSDLALDNAFGARLVRVK